MIWVYPLPAPWNLLVCSEDLGMSVLETQVFIRLTAEVGLVSDGHVATTHFLESSRDRVASPDGWFYLSVTATMAE